MARNGVSKARMPRRQRCPAPDERASTLQSRWALMSALTSAVSGESYGIWIPRARISVRIRSASSRSIRLRLARASYRSIMDSSACDETPGRRGWRGSPYPANPRAGRCCGSRCVRVWRFWLSVRNPHISISAVALCCDYEPKDVSSHLNPKRYRT